MTWYRNIFVDTLSSNEGALVVTDLGLTNRISFREVPNAILYTLYGRRTGEQSWIVIDSIDVGSGEFNTEGGFIDNFDWIQTPTPVAIEYKVEVTKQSPVVSDRYYTTGLDGRSNDDDIVPVNRIAGIYETAGSYMVANIDYNFEMSSRSDWDGDPEPGTLNVSKYGNSLPSTISDSQATTNVNGVTVNWMDRNVGRTTLNEMSDKDFETHLTQLKNIWRDLMAANIRFKQAERGLVMSEVSLYASDPEIKNADAHFSFGFHLAGFYQYGVQNGFTINNNQLENNIYFRWNETTRRAEATEKANIFIRVWLKGLHSDFTSTVNDDLELTGKFSHYNLPYRFASTSLGADVFKSMNEGEIRQFILDTMRVQSGDLMDGIDGLDHATMDEVYETCGTFADFYPAPFADRKDTWMAWIDALESFGIPGRNTTMMNGKFNDPASINAEPCSDWRGHLDLINKPYYSDSDWYTQTEEDSSSGCLMPLSVYMYMQDYIVNNTNLGLCRFWLFGPDNTMFGSANQIPALNVQMPPEFGTPYSDPPSEQNKVGYSEYRSYGQWAPTKDYTKISRPEGIPSSRTIDRSPFYINYFASFSGFRESYGIAGGVDGGRSDWLHTPAFGNVSALQNPEQNGRLFYVQQQIINKALSGGRMFNRVMIGNPAGFVAGEPLSGSNEDNQGYYTNKAGTGLLVDQVNSYDTRANNFQIGQDTELGLVNTYPTPFTPNGLPGEEARGDQVSSWKVATDALRAAGVQEVFCYLGYGQAYETPSKDSIDDNLLAFAPGWARSEKEPSVYPADEWQRQWDILSECGFDNASFDAGTRIARKNNESDYLAGDQRIKTIADIVGTDNQIFELIPRDPDGGMKLNGTWDYTKNKGWGLFPVSSGVQVDGEFYGKINTGSQFVIDFTTWDLDPATTEHHAVLDLQSLITEPWVNNSQSGKIPNGRLMVFSEFKKLVDTLRSKGLIVSVTSWSSSSMVDDINGGTVGPGDLCDYVLNSNP